MFRQAHGARDADISRFDCKDFDLGASVEEIQTDYPTLEADTIRQLVEFAHARRRSAA